MHYPSTKHSISFGCQRLSNLWSIEGFCYWCTTIYCRQLAHHKEYLRFDLSWVFVWPAWNSSIHRDWHRQKSWWTTYLLLCPWNKLYWGWCPYSSPFAFAIIRCIHPACTCTTAWFCCAPQSSCKLVYSIYSYGKSVDHDTSSKLAPTIVQDIAIKVIFLFGLQMNFRNISPFLRTT